MMTIENDLRGVITALVTPFRNGELDLKSFARLLRTQMEQGVRGFVVNGTTGESPTLSRDEVKTLFELAKTETGGDAILLLGTGLNSTAATIEFTKLAKTWGAHAALVVVPYYNRPPQRGMLQHFKKVAAESDIPIVLYNVPGRTVASLEPETVVTLSEIKNIVGIKDATGDMKQIDRMKANAHAKFIYLSGDDGTCVDYATHGGQGVISVSSHIIGKEMNRYLEQARTGNQKAVSTYTSEYSDLMKHLYIEPNPIPVKMALYWMGILESPELRLPLVELDSKYHKEFKACLEKLGKL